MIFIQFLAYFSLSDSPKLPIIVPQPLNIQLNDGNFILDSDTGISYDSTFPNLSSIMFERGSTDRRNSICEFYLRQ